jgi:Pyruvate/2-oxoacid:ferredoxin oxidoreductase delta subunit
MRSNNRIRKYVPSLLLYLGALSHENMQIEGFLSCFSLLRVTCDKEKCISCGKCRQACPMNVDMTDNSRKRLNGTECILCMECVKACPRKAL